MPHASIEWDRGIDATARVVAEFPGFGLDLYVSMRMAPRQVMTFHGDEGWLRRLCDNLSWCLSQDSQNQDAVKLSAVKTMNALRACMPWVIPKAIAAVQVIEHVCKALAVPVVELQVVRTTSSTLLFHQLIASS